MNRFTRSCCLLAGAMAVAAGAAEPAGRIVVTAQREPTDSLTLVGNTARIEEDRLRLLAPTHAADLGRQAAGTWLARGAQQESLPAIRSPVLTGPGSCGAFLMLEDGIPVRPAGFCNVNELFEVLTEQAVAMEVLRGPSGALYGAGGMHGTLNFLLPEPGGPDGVSGSGELGPNHYWRGTTRWDAHTAGAALTGGVMVDHDGDFRDDAGYQQAKGFAKLRRELASGELDVGFTATVLDQDSAGYIVGKDAYRDPALRTENLNPGSYRDADSQRLQAHWIPAADHPWAGTDLRAFLRRSSMEFLQHFLPGQPREENSQWSGGLMALRERELTGDARLALGLDLEFAHGTLEEFQAGESGLGTSPPGQHYDYVAQSYLGAPFVRLALPLTPAWLLQLGLRAEYMLYDYDNRMIDGNTRDDGTPCTPAPCRFSRPADRSDDFLNLAPDIGLLYRLSPVTSAYARLIRGFRPPQATELYRLQAQQAVADLDSETLDSAELGLRWQPGPLRLELVGFLMKKRDYIFQDADRFNVSDGRTRHRGLELQADARASAGAYAGFAGTWARHSYGFSSSTPGGERIVTGNDVDTAPHTLASAHIGLDRSVGLAEFEWVHVGSHYLDAANTARYGGHNLLNLRALWRATPALSLTLRVNNLADEYYAERADFAFGDYRYFPGRDRELYVELAYNGR